MSHPKYISVTGPRQYGNYLQAIILVVKDFLNLTGLEFQVFKSCRVSESPIKLVGIKRNAFLVLLYIKRHKTPERLHVIPQTVGAADLLKLHNVVCQRDAYSSSFLLQKPSQYPLHFPSLPAEY